MIGNTVSRRYAQALFNLGKEAGMEILERYGQSIFDLGHVIEHSVALTKILSNPVLLLDEKKNLTLALLAKVGGGEMEKRFCKLLADKGRLSLLPAIATDYKKMLDDAKGISEGVVTSAMKLDDQQQNSIATYLEKKTSRKLELVFKVDKKILGGIMLKIEDKLFDASIRKQLEMIKESIKRGE